MNQNSSELRVLRLSKNRAIFKCEMHFVFVIEIKNKNVKIKRHGSLKLNYQLFLNLILCSTQPYLDLNPTMNSLNFIPKLQIL